jgi:hypothetical protein
MRNIIFQKKNICNIFSFMDCDVKDFNNNNRKLFALVFWV